MEINRVNLDALYTGYNLVYLRAYQTYVDETWKKLGMILTGRVGKIDLPLLEQIAGMRRWVGPREVKNLSADKMTIEAVRWEDTVGVDQDKIEDDQHGVFNPMFEMMAKNAANLGSQMIDELLKGAADAKWADGEDFFKANRKYGTGSKAGTINNVSDQALSFASFNAAYKRMRSYKGHGGQKLGVRPNILAHGPQLRIEVADLIKSDKRVVTPSSGKGATVLPNPNYNIVETVELDGIEGGNWFLLDTSQPYKPIAVFMRKEPNKLIRKDKEDDDNVFFDGQLLYGTYGRAEAAFAVPHLIYGNFVS